MGWLNRQKVQRELQKQNLKILMALPTRVLVRCEFWCYDPLNLKLVHRNLIEPILSFIDFNFGMKRTARVE